MSELICFECEQAEAESPCGRCLDCCADGCPNSPHDDSEED